MDFPLPDAEALCAVAHTFYSARVSCSESMSINLWIVLCVAFVVALAYVLAVRVLYRQSREVDKHVDFSKIRPLPDDDGKD